MIDPADAAHKLKGVLPALDEEVVRNRLSSAKQFVYLARQITPKQELAINALGIPGVYFQPGERRSYPQRSLAAQVLGGVGRGTARGIAGVEKFFDDRLRDDPEPLRLSLDVRGPGGAARRIGQVHGRIHRHRRLRHRHGRAHRRDHRHGQPARL